MSTKIVPCEGSNTEKLESVLEKMCWPENTPADDYALIPSGLKQSMAIGLIAVGLNIAPPMAVQSFSAGRSAADIQRNLEIVDESIDNAFSFVLETEEFAQQAHFSLDSLIDGEEIKLNSEIISDYMDTMRPFIKSRKKKISFKNIK